MNANVIDADSIRRLAGWHASRIGDAFANLNWEPGGAYEQQLVLERKVDDCIADMRELAETVGRQAREIAELRARLLTLQIDNLGDSQPHEPDPPSPN